MKCPSMAVDSPAGLSSPKTARRSSIPSSHRSGPSSRSSTVANSSASGCMLKKSSNGEARARSGKKSEPPASDHDIILGVDPGIVATGWAVLDESLPTQHRVRAHGTIRTNPDANDAQRVAAIAHILRGVVSDHGVTLVAVEHQAQAWRGHNERGTTNANASKVQLVEGTALGLVPDSVQVSPQTAKRTLAGSGSASKEQMKLAAARFGMHGRVSEHAADACGIALAGLMKWRKERVQEKRNA